MTVKPLKSSPLSRWFTAFASLAIGAGVCTAIAQPASAQAAYGSYIGVGGSFGLSDGPNGEGSQSGVVIAVRYRLLEAPISLRAQALIADRTAFVPTVSYDIPLNWQTDAYIGAGVALQSGGAESSSPLGDQTSFVIQPGVDYSLPDSNLVLFGNAIIAFDAYRDSNQSAASIQGGLGVRF
ncbi:hypothetical protein [Leptolyngbya ohadii]|uniref:hypothetical protein n=1 Tax=Leptolyngbya ohadii TaxID=1962290 RepID=UPI000B59A5EA|nr:hypothetical protein [Leptolyngbya ohadii]